MILTFLAALSIGLPSAANCAGAMTIAAGLDATAFARIPIWPLTSDSESAPCSTTLTPSSCPALRGPAQPPLQLKDLLFLSMNGKVGLVCATALAACAELVGLD